MDDGPEPTPRPDELSAPPPASSEWMINGPKLLRLESAVAGMLGEVRALEEDHPDPARMGELVRRMVVEVGSCLPDPLLEELSRLMRPLESSGVAESSSRLALAQLEGWLGALAAECAAAI